MSDGNVAADQLRQYIERVERLEDEKKGMQEDIKDVYLEARSQGYDPKTMKAIVRLRKMEKDARDEAEALLETYKAALGMSSTLYPDHDGRPDPKTPAPEPTASPDELYVTAVGLVVQHGKASTSWLQRQMRVGYNAAARLVERMEAAGIVGPPDHVGRREVLLDAARAGWANVVADLAAKGITVSVHAPAEARAQ
jgi:uncharacterized protein (UPF0335 family)